MNLHLQASEQASHQTFCEFPKGKFYITCADEIMIPIISADRNGNGKKIKGNKSSGGGTNKPF